MGYSKRSEVTHSTFQSHSPSISFLGEFLVSIQCSTSNGIEFTKIREFASKILEEEIENLGSTLLFGECGDEKQWESKENGFEAEE